MSKFEVYASDVKWAADCLDNYENRCKLEEFTDVDELWDWANLLKDRANKLAALVSE